MLYISSALHINLLDFKELWIYVLAYNPINVSLSPFVSVFNVLNVLSILFAYLY